MYYFNTLTLINGIPQIIKSKLSFINKHTSRFYKYYKIDFNKALAALVRILSATIK